MSFEPIALFPPRPLGLRGRKRELATLARTIRSIHPLRLALVGAGGSGKSMLAAALGHELSTFFEGRVDWFRVGAWDFSTLTEILALQFGVRRGGDRVLSLRAFFEHHGARLVVLDNHEDDRAMARFLDAFDGAPVTFLITARRCLLSGVFVYPVTAPLVVSGEHAFERVRDLTRLLRHNPLALDVADSIVAAGDASVAELRSHLVDQGVERVRAVAHEDDLPEIALLVEWAFERLSADSRRLLAVLAFVEGDHVDRESLFRLAQVTRARERALAALERWHLVQEPVPGRFTLHAVVRHALRRRTSFDTTRFFDHYVDLLERDPDRLRVEHSHLFAAMDHAHRHGDLAESLRVQRLVRTLDALDET